MVFALLLASYQGPACPARRCHWLSPLFQRRLSSSSCGEFRVPEKLPFGRFAPKKLNGAQNSLPRSVNCGVSLDAGAVGSLIRNPAAKEGRALQAMVRLTVRHLVIKSPALSGHIERAGKIIALRTGIAIARSARHQQPLPGSSSSVATAPSHMENLRCRATLAWAQPKALPGATLSEKERKDTGRTGGYQGRIMPLIRRPCRPDPVLREAEKRKRLGARG
jgi:hypothetical protein